ncbi:MAG: hypothetical protein M1818_003700 [Claussenomyces sp. TS43310]|nr:MAG: hypothetical protein M1818_003700 [Claussenomyces sp. TS43310]
MDGFNISRGQQATLDDAQCVASLPPEIVDIIRYNTSPNFLDALAIASLVPTLTLKFFARFENIFADTCARWISRSSDLDQKLLIIEAFARILPFAPHLSVFERYLGFDASNDTGHGSFNFLALAPKSNISLADLSDIQLQRLLLAALRLLIYDEQTFSASISAAKIQSLLRHETRPIRYLSVQIICRLLCASDAKVEAMLSEHVGQAEMVMGPYDGRTIDYGFLALYEEKNAEDVRKYRRELLGYPLRSTSISPPFSASVACYGNTLLPRPDGIPPKSTLVSTKTTLQNMEILAKAMLSSAPILVHGLSGAGKTALVNDLARELGKESTMVTLHLNEQTDAKMLIGMYTTDSKPGSFTWRAGVLTTAVREGRWVFIEDLDRAPNEVISVLLPLIERGELIISSRGETIRAAAGFKLVASIRTSLNMSGHENPLSTHMLGARLWNKVPVNMASRDEFDQIINGTYPILHKFLPGIIAVYERLCALYQKPSFASKNRTSLGRPISPRDLLKWCRRLNALLIAAGSKTGAEPITETTKSEMFMEAADCFASSLQTEESRRLIIYEIAEEMQIAPQQVEYYLDAHIPLYESNPSHLTIGRVRLPKRNIPNRVVKTSRKARPFASTTHAKRLLEQVGVAVKLAEPVLLVGETGIGKTAVIQQLADSLGYKLTAVNLSQQSEVGDLLGGFKPVNVRSLAIPLKEEFDDLFVATGISTSRNQKYLDALGKCVAKGQWSKAAKLWREAPRMFERILSDISKLEVGKLRDSTEHLTKRRKTESKLQALLDLKPRWIKFSQDLAQFDVQLTGGSRGFAFTFVEGNIVKAVRNGEWVLLDEINLASPDTLESIADLLHSGPNSAPSVLLSETGEIERVQAHPDFRIFGAMNPATDVGKRDLPMGLRSRFTEIYVGSPDRNLDDLLAVVKAYLKGLSSSDERAAHDVARLYLNTKRLAGEKRLVDGANQIPHFSLRTLTRVLSYATEIAPSYGLRRALYEGYSMGFLTLLDRESERMLMPLITHHLLESHGNPQSLLAQTPKHSEDGRQYVRFMNKKRDRQYWMLQGHESPQEQTHYVITPSVERNMLNLVRATSTRRFPVLVQGPTSAGKTSMIEYLAKFSGNKFVRINNHEHTDLQEYLGTYVSGSDGQLRFQEGLLVQALRQGHWIVLDELNLAPTDVLEALNRLLDDNRELLIPETQEIIRPHENFMLFATQNPPGLYGGRKTLSRAFRNRFLELHFDDIPEDELEYILQHRSQKVAPSDCKRIVTVYKELSRLRQTNRLFEQKDSFATLRDLFRWALRDSDNREQLAANGYMLLGERVRKQEERIAVKEIIERVMKVKIDTSTLYSSTSSPEIRLFDETTNIQGVVWTNAMRRLYVLVAHALRNNEPVLLVGETGCGKTTVCQMLADAFQRQLHIVNAHQNTETGDLIGAQRPVRNRALVSRQLRDQIVTALNAISKGDQSGTANADLDTLLATYNGVSREETAGISYELREQIRLSERKAKALFEWSDGSLVQAMKEAQFFLLDEISLADDSVLERLNSVLESQRTLLLAEKGIEDSFVQAAEGFQFFATMNPGGDYGKRELSPALRNRFTEIWVPSLSEHQDVFQIVEEKLATEMKRFSKAIVDFAEWFGQTYRSSSAQSISVRDVLAWAKFINGCNLGNPYLAVLHGAAMVFIDTLGANPAALLAINPETIQAERMRCLQQLGTFTEYDMVAAYPTSINILTSEHSMSFGDFSIDRCAGGVSDAGFAFEAPTTKLNAMRVVRALQVQKPILIEGSPGVGKTTLIAALAKAAGKHLVRINLSEQSDISDLFGSDIPVSEPSRSEGAEAGNFAWRDAPFMQAMQHGDWVLLDEMNLASQSVLEGLNACLDHRGEVFIPELDQSFKKHPNFSVFAAQNPHHQGGGRKGLPSSFVNRFTVVYADVFRNDDLMLICKHNFPSMDYAIMSKVITFVSMLEQEVVYKRRIGSQGGPWELNLRDTLRWLELLKSQDPLLASRTPADFLNIIFRQRFRSLRDRDEVDKVFEQVFGSHIPFRHLFHNLAADAYQVGMAYLPRHKLVQHRRAPDTNIITRLPELESVMICIQQNIPCILVGPSGSGKSSLIKHVAATTGADLVVFPMNADIDTMDLVGGFEQVDPQRAIAAFRKTLSDFLRTLVLSSLPSDVPVEATELLRLCQGTEPPSTYFHLVEPLLIKLQSKTAPNGLDRFLSACQHFIRHPHTIDNARFEWVDGILVKALEEGKWLVLDNANLCSSSVLDRLNGLLEPNGVLILDEHCGPNGEPNLVKPHPDFRVFMTTDPRYGELSRAMRNRSIEIYLDPEAGQKDHISLKESEAATDSSLRRLRRVIDALELSEADHNRKALVVRASLDHLTSSDTHLLPRFAQAVNNELVDKEYLDPKIPLLFQQYYDLTHSGSTTCFGDFIRGLYRRLAIFLRLPERFEDAQTIHPLQDSPLSTLLQLSCGNDQAFWLGTLLEMQLDVFSGRAALIEQSQALQSLKPSLMNRLQRSMISDRVAAVGKDSTVSAASFLSDTLDALNTHIHQQVSNPQQWKRHKEILTNIFRLWWDTYRLVTEHNFEEATFQAHLALGSKLLHASSSTSAQGLVDVFPCDVLGFVQSRVSQDFDTGFKLTTGLSMEQLWVYFRPRAISSSQILQDLMDLESLASRFDALRWKISISVSTLTNIMSSLVTAYRLVLASEADGQSLVQALETELSDLEAQMSKESTDIAPFLSAQFEALRQYRIIHAMRNSKELSDDDIVSTGSEISVLASHPTTSLMQLASASNTSQSLQLVDYFCREGRDLKPIEDSFSSSLFRRLLHSSDVDLRSLRLWEAEVPILGQQIVQTSELLCRDQTADINGVLFELIMSVMEAHDTGLAKILRQWFGEQSKEELRDIQPTDLLVGGAGWPNENFTEAMAAPHLQKVFEDHLKPALKAIAASTMQPKSRLTFSSMAWIHFSIGFILLYVPNRSYDPDRRQRLELHRYEELSQSIRGKIDALREFERMFSGQNSNLRCQLLEEELIGLGQAPVSLQQTCRPDVSELEQLQGEFNNLLNAIIQSNPLGTVLSYITATNGSAVHELKLLQSNLQQITRRLSERFRGYSDMTTPILGILRAFRVGLSIAGMVPCKDSPSDSPIQTLSKLTPFLGGGPFLNMPAISDHPLETLENLAAASAVEGLDSFGFDRRRILFDTFHACYEQWSKRLDEDRKEAESSTGLYRFRGGADDEDKEDQYEFNELFPMYDEDISPPVDGTASSQSARNMAVTLAEVHQRIVEPDASGAKSVMLLIKHMTERIGTFHSDETNHAGGDMTRKLLPGALLLINDRIEGLSTDTRTGTNFYVDANLSESRKLVHLVYQIQNRFRELQGVDEIAHMQPLEDVLVSCRELLDFRHTEPLAKIITKVEKVHAYMHEWQFGGWASRANSALSLYDNLTQTIVGYRRLELSTWARLFDMEDQKCNDDAKSWWFVAYQVVVAAPLGMSDSEDELRNYAQELLETLATYFGTAIQGQFTQRILVLSQLHKHLELLESDIPSLSIISTAVGNFLEIYVRYEKSVADNILKGRTSLEKAMKDILLLASWKDTNIVALRDSARRSHHKLFKLVRKYRALLGQPMDVVLKQGLPDQNDIDNMAYNHLHSSPLPHVDKAALAICEAHIPHWHSKSKRFLNVSKTVGIMQDTSRIPESAVDGSEYLESFLTNIITSIAELGKATPSTLTEDNKVTVKHLKSRKRKLFSDTLKELRHMGVKYNLDTSALARQGSLSIILANASRMPTVDSLGSRGFEYYFHKSLDLLPRVRDATRQHNEDLSGAEVARSAGLIEGLLQISLKQRTVLAGAKTDLDKLNRVVKEVKGFWAPGAYEVKVAVSTSTIASTLQWVPSILRVGSELVNIHNRFGGKTEAADTLNSLASWIEEFESLARHHRDLPVLPTGIESTDHAQLVSKTQVAVEHLDSDLAGIRERHPDLDYILCQISPWTGVASDTLALVEESADISVLDGQLSKASDAILVAIEKLAQSMQAQPGSTDDPLWLVKHDQCLVNDVSSLHIKEIILLMNQAFDIFKTLDLKDASVAQAACAVFALALPILDQYARIVDDLIMRYARLYRATCKTTSILANTFVQIASQGFCTPAEKSEADDGKTEKLEGGTGLGDGEGAEDISKDIQDDEDLSELAQEPNQGSKDEIEDQEDAVDMADGEMEGEMGEAGDKDEEGLGDEESEGEDMDEEAGDVDDLDPNAIDEKMWDGEGEKADKDQEGDESKGKPDSSEQVAAQENDKEGAEGDEGGDEDEETAGAEQSEEVRAEEKEKHDPHAEEGEALELPAEMELDGEGNEKDGSVSESDDDMEDMSDVNEDFKDAEEQVDETTENEPNAEDAQGQEDQDMGSDVDIVDLDEKDDGGEGDKTEDAGEKVEDAPESPPEEQEGLLRDQTDSAIADADNIAPSDAQGTGKGHEEQEQDQNAETTAQAQREEGGKGGQSSEQDDAAAEQGEKARQASGDAPQTQNDDTDTSGDAQPFKKLGDALEKWHRQQNKIREAPEQQEKSHEQGRDVDGKDTDFQHLQDEDAEADTQALGTATEDQAHAIDESMAIDTESKEMPETFPPDEIEPNDAKEDESMSAGEEDEEAAQKESDAYEGRAGAMIRQSNADDDRDREDHHDQQANDVEGEVEEVDSQLATTHIDDPVSLSLSRSAADARSLWAHFESVTRDLSLALTEQLRLILAPTLATKMRGDFRTGKRLNIKRIIPYIASQYKRDKIWMRRSVPSKRSYQIMLAVDDSKSMGETGSGSLALETLVMVSKSLSMLEVGQICVVGFGQDVHVTHEFETPFSSDAGPNIFSNFAFEQSRTDVTKLIRTSIELFRTARAKATGSPADLWQLQLIISDGVCDSSEHDAIRRLLREAMEERIMMVFVIVDDVKNKKKGESVMDLKEAKFVKDEVTGASGVKIERYLDTFPFQYYLIVSDVQELPGVLATLLRQWFAEVVDSSA